MTEASKFIAMPPEHTSSANQSHPTWLLVGLGVVALAAAMGIGRFAFTPLLPLMLRDGTLDEATGAGWAAANYAGYLAGAATAGWWSREPGRGLRLSLLGVALATLAAAWIGSGTPLVAGLVLRAAAGVFSAWSLVCTSSVVLGTLARRGVPQLGAWVYAGVGVGIALSGTLAWLGGWQPAARLWLQLGLAALVAAAAVILGLRDVGQAVPARVAAAAEPGSVPFVPLLCYAVSGFGYIVPATFLPAMARQQVSNPLVFGLAWPLFGLAAAFSVMVAARWLSGWPRLRIWGMAQGIMAAGIAMPAMTTALWAVATSAVLVGGTFMVVTMAGLQWARELRPANPTPLLARMTLVFAAGQVVGPVLVRLLTTMLPDGRDPLVWASAAASILLVLSAAWLCRGSGSIPLEEPAP